MEKMAVLLPERGGVFLQMEDEISAMGAVIGSSWTGSKSMTATSGPGFSLMQENIGYAAMTETPCVIVDAQRGGPSTGLPTLPSQGDVMQACWGSHGDRPGIVLTASSVRDVYEFTVESFNFAERYRLPVVLLLDAMLANMRENVELPEIEIVNRTSPKSVEDFPAVWQRRVHVVRQWPPHRGDRPDARRDRQGARGRRCRKRAHVAQVDGQARSRPRSIAALQDIQDRRRRVRDRGLRLDGTRCAGRG